MVPAHPFRYYTRTRPTTAHPPQRSGTAAAPSLKRIASFRALTLHAYKLAAIAMTATPAANNQSRTSPVSAMWQTRCADCTLLPWF